MARYFNVALFFAVVVVAASAQFDYFGGYPGGFGAAAPRDPRDNRGPVTFPITQPGSETSGVRIGASGYGFIPPGSRGGKHTLLPKKIISTIKKSEIRKFSGLTDIEELVDKAMSNLENINEEAKVETDIHQEGAEEQVDDALGEAKAVIDESLLDADGKIEFIMKNWNFGKSESESKGQGVHGSGPSAFNGLRYW